MRCINRLLCVLCAGVLAAGFSACSAAAGEAAVPGKTAAAPVQSEPASAESTASVTQGSETYRGFVLDNVLHSETDGDIHFNLYVPDRYDGSQAYALFVTLPGYEGLYFQGVGSNLRSEAFGFEAQQYNAQMLIAARTPVYMAVGEEDSYYGSEPLKSAYEELRGLYMDMGLTQAQISDLLVLDVKDQAYFTERGYRDQHAGGGAFAYDETIMGWLFSH